MSFSHRGNTSTQHSRVLIRAFLFFREIFAPKNKPFCSFEYFQTSLFIISTIFTPSPASPCPSFIPKGCRWRRSRTYVCRTGVCRTNVLEQAFCRSQPRTDVLFIFSDRTRTRQRIYNSNKCSYLLNARKCP